MEEDGPVPDRLRCNRTDGRQWRCKNRVKDNLKLCETHYLQGRHRQHKQKVPESLKMQRSNGRSAAIRRSVKVRATKVEIVAKLMKKRSGEGFRKRTKRGNTELELIRMVLKREVEKSNGKSLRLREREISTDDDSEEEELTRDLPNGLMAISSNSLSLSQGNAGSDLPLGVKVGAISGPVTMMRRFRSKNVEALPIDKWQVLPSSQTGAKLSRDKRKKCHWCRRSGSQILTKCSSCQKQFFCLDCIKERYFDTQDEVKEACPVCRRTCTCKDCFRNSYTDTESKEFLGEKHSVEVILCIHYLICMLLPVLKQINVNQSDELEIEARIKGIKPNKLEIKQAVIGCNDQHCCNKCKGHILDLHRSCPNCSYNLCLSCCRDLHHEGLHEGTDMRLSVSLDKKKSKLSNSTRRTEEKPKRTKRNPSNNYLSSTVSLAHETSCPPMNFGGCGDGLLELRCLFPSSWTRELEARAEQIVCSYDCPDMSDIDSCCSLCQGTNQRAEGIDNLQEAALRKDATDNFLYHPTLVEIHSDNVEHFQKHWLKGHPIIVRNVLKATLDLSWDPVLMFCTYLEQSISRRENNGGVCEASTCLDWCQVEIGMSQCFMGSLSGETRKNSWNETLKLKGWLSSELFKQQFPDHYSEIIYTLPLQEYMNPASGLLNLAARLPQGVLKPDLGPCLYISYGYAEQLVQADSVIKLHYDSYDVVNVLAHTSDDPISDEQVSKVRKLLKKHKAQKQSSSSKADQNLVNGVERKPLLSDDKIRASGSSDRIGEEMHFRKKVAVVSCSSSITTHGSYERNLLQSKTPDAESDSETDSDSEGLLARRRSYGSVTSEGVKSNGKHSQVSSCTAQWDVFRRQDVSKLTEYLRRHSNELSGTSDFHDKVVHPILDQSFFLDASHKMRLKQEYKIEPWTFQQRVGEAVVIPAGCPYQIRSPKSCVHVVLDFLSPENVRECVHLTDEIRQLPTGHKAKVDNFEVKKIALHSLSEAVKKIRELTCATAS